MSVYSDLLRMALDGDEPGAERPLAELTRELLARRPTATTRPSPMAGRPADRIGDTIAYDVALIRLCEHLSIDHGLVGDAPILTLRREAEARLAARLPLIADSLVDLGTEDDSRPPSDLDPARRPAARPDPRLEP